MCQISSEARGFGMWPTFCACMGASIIQAEEIPELATLKVELFAETLRLAVRDQGEGHAFLLLHGGAGPMSVSGLADALSKNGRAVVPTHPGFDGEPRPDRFARIDDLVLAYLALIDQLDLSRVIVIGNSVD